MANTRANRALDLLRGGALAAFLCFVAVMLASAPGYGQNACASMVTQAASLGSGNWSVDGTWDVGCFPDNANTSTTINATVTLDINATVDDLTIGSADALNISGTGSTPGTGSNIGLLVAGTSISNAGAINLNANATSQASGTLYIGNDATLSGGGTINLSSNPIYGQAYITQSGQTFHTLTNVDNTIQGNGIIGNGGLRLVNEAGGVIDATTATGESTTLTLTGGGTITNTGLMEATSGTLVIYNPVTNTGGNITANGGTVELGDAGAGETAAFIAGGTLSAINGGTLGTAPGEVTTLDGVTISNGSTYTAPDNSFTHVQGTITNNGTISMTGGSGHNSTINLDADTTLTGGGTVTLATISTGGGVALVQENGAAGTPVFTLTNADNTIQGNGLIGNSGMALVNGSSGVIDATTASGQITTLTLNVTGKGGTTNQGLMEATNGAKLVIQSPVANDASGTITAGIGSEVDFLNNQAVTNQGLIQETGGTLLIQDPITNTGGNITADGGLVQLNGNTVSITGGTLNTEHSGTMETVYSATLNGVTISSGSTYTASNNASTHLQGAITNKGAIDLNGGNGTFGYLYIDSGGVTLTGGGTITLSSSTTPTNYGDASITQAGNIGAQTLTNVDNTIQGNGIIGAYGLMVVNEAGGVINATTASGQLGALTLTGGGTITNTGLMEATSGALVILNPVANTGGNITADGGTVELGDAGAGLNAAFITGGTLNTINGGTMETVPGQVATLDGVTISSGSTYTAPDNTFTHIQGTITNNGTIAMTGGNAHNSTINLDTDVTLTGGGTVTLATNTTGGGVALIQENGAAGTPAYTLTNADNTIQGNGVIGNLTGLVVDNKSGGTIEATTASGQINTLSINAGGSVTNTGTFGADTGAKLLVSSPISSSTYSSGTLLTGTYNANGTIQLNALGSTGGEIVTNNANIILDGSNSGAALITDSSGTKNALSNLATNNGSFTVESGGNADFTTAGNFQNSGTVYIDSASTLTTGAGGSHNYTQSGGLTTVNGTLSSSTITVNGGLVNGTGTLAGTVTVNPGGTVQPGDAPGTLNIIGSLAINGTLDEAIDSAVSFDVLNITGTPGSLTLGSGSTLDILLASGYDPAAGTSFTIASASGGLSGVFDSILNGTFNGGTEDWDVTYNGNDIVLTAGNVSTPPTTVDGTWTAGSAASWTAASNWACSPGPSTCVPSNGAPANTVYDVNIDNPTSGATMTLSTSETANTLALTSGTLDIASSGSLNLANQPNGITDIPNGADLSVEGSFTAGSNSALASLTSVEGGLNLDNGQTTAVTPSGGTLAVAGTGSLSVSAPSTVLAVTGNVSNSGSVDVGNGASLSANGTYTQASGSTDVAGTLMTNTYDATGGTTTISSGGKLNATSAYDQMGSSTLTNVRGTLTSPAVNVSGGTLSGTGMIEGDVAVGNGGTLLPGETGTPGTLSITGNADLSGADFMELLGGGTAGTSYGVLEVGSSLMLSSTELSLADLNGFTPANGEMFDIIDAGSISGTFSDSTVAFAGGMFTVDYLTSGCSSGYADCVHLIWQSGAAPSSTPEPSSLILLGTGLLGLAWTVRRKARRGAENSSVLRHLSTTK